MKRWISERKLIWMFSLLMGLVVGLSVNFYKLSQPVQAQEKSEAFYPIAKTKALDDASYWRGRVDSKLEAIDKKIDEFYIQIEKLNTHLTEVRITAAKDGSIYGGVTSLIVLLVSLVAQGVFKAVRNGKR
ncbi:MAG: hypothetical protein Q8M94_15795 [Ignavibacteria bacterium]|nr:hypothetical protein [Ignavibacteria bacterium]